MRASPDRVIIRNARQHNLKGITVELPRRALTVITGPSGSGKSTLAFDTLYAEGQRRHIESLWTYAKQFPDRMPRPLVDAIEGISPAVALEQKNPTTSSRSTVGTATEIYDFLRLLWARVGTQFCVKCGHEVKVDTVQEVVDHLIADCGLPIADLNDHASPSAIRNPQSAIVVTFPLPPSAHRPDVELAAQLRAAGFVRAQLDGAVVRLDEPDAERRVRGAEEVLVVVDRLPASEGNRGRLADAVATAFNEGEGVAVALENGDRRRFSEHPTCSHCATAAPALTPILFSFNNPRGACPGCNGFGAVLEYDESLIVPDPKQSLAQGALDPWTKPRYEGRRRILRETARARGIPLDTAWRDLPERDRHFLLHGATGRFLGMLPFLERLEVKRYKQYIRVFLRQYQLAKTCPACGAARLKPAARAVRVGGKNIAEVAALTAGGVRELAAGLHRPPAARAAAAWMIELGPGSRGAGGQVVYQGRGAGVCEAGTLTGQYLSGEKRIGVPSARRPARRWLALSGARLHNLAGVDIRIPLGTLTVVTGVSGSGKSTLVHDVLFRQLEARLTGAHTAKQHLGEPVGAVHALEGWEAIADVVLVDQAPIGRTPRSNPVTYIKAIDGLRGLFAAEPLARPRRYTPSTLSFKGAGGRCEACEGAGHVLVEMVFLANVFVPCEMCEGKRFKKEVLEVKLQGSGIHEVLEWTVDQALQRFHRQPRLARALWHLQQVGLGYLRLGQPATTLSGGEAQRLKIARELALAGATKRGAGGRKLYILDEPTTGLHLDDVRTLCRVLDRLVDAGHTVLVIEHHLDVVKRADWIIDLGPGAGEAGGRVVAQGTPENVARVAASATGRYLRDLT